MISLTITMILTVVLVFIMGRKGENYFKEH